MRALTKIARGSRSCAPIAFVTALALAPAPATAAVHQLSSSPSARAPDVAVDEAGTAHVVWLVRDGDGDEDVVYCRVPRGATACASTRSFGLGGRANDPRVNLMPTGELVITSERFADDPQGSDPNNKVYAIGSTDGGVTFEPPRVIASRTGTIWGWGGEVEPGPGNFSLSLFGNSGGCNDTLNYSAAPLDGFTTDAATLTDLCAKSFEPSVAFIDPITPLVAYTDLERIFYRRWGGSGAYNDAATWLPETVAPFGGGEPRLAGGPRGAFLLYRDPEPPFDYFARRFDPASGSFGAPSMVSADDGESARFRDFSQDAGGTLHAVFVEGSPAQLRHALQPPGEGWRAPTAIAPGDSFFNLRAAAAPDGGGAAVADANAKGPIYLVPFAPTGGTGACPAQIKLGGARVQALEGCFEKRKGGRRAAAGPVKVNGVDIEAAAGSAAAAAKFEIVVDKEARTLKSSAKADVRAGNVLLDRATVGWKLPKGTGRVKKLAGADDSVFKDIGKYTKKLFEFPVEGDAELLVGKGGTASVPTHFGLPKLVGGVSGDVTLGTDPDGFDPAGLKIKVPAAEIGLLRISEIEVTYSGQNEFTGTAKLELPPAYGRPFTVGFGFQDGRFNYLHYDQPFQPILPIVAAPPVGAPPEPLVGLHSLAIDYVDAPASRKFTGSIKIVGGGKYLGYRAAELDGKVTLEFPAKGPASIGARGDLKVVTVPLASAGVQYSTDGLFSFDGSFTFPPPGMWQSLFEFKGSIDGWVSVADPVRFSASGSASGRVGFLVGSGDGVISSKGVGICVSFPQLPPPADFIPDMGISYEWGDTLPTPVCNVGSFKLAKPVVGTGGGALAANATRVEIPRGLPQAAIEITGAGAAPRVTVTAPNGDEVTTRRGTVASGRFIATEFAEAAKSYVTIGEPPAGSYSIVAAEGSAPIERTRVAEGLADPRVKARVSGRGRKRAVRYKVRRIPGQKVTFAEQSKGGLYRELGTTAKGRGELRFRPTDSRQRKRRIVALVEQDGLPRARLPLDRFTAPKPRPPAKPRKVRLKRRGSKLRASWRRVKRASGYRVELKLPKDGREILRHTGARKTRITLGGLERTDSARLTVRAIGGDARPGKPGSAKLRPKRRR